MRPIQQVFTFFAECREKFGPVLGPLIWEELNKVFDCLPLCAIVDEQIYTAHGGIPASTVRLEPLYNAPTPLPDPNSMCKPAWEVLWNDPVSRSDYQDFLDFLVDVTAFPRYPLGGFVPNIKRSTAFYWCEDALNQFKDHNALTYVIRAHEVTILLRDSAGFSKFLFCLFTQVIPSGFQFAMDGQMMTIFSSSNYCGAANESAVVFIEGGKMRVIKIETNAPFVDL